MKVKINKSWIPANLQTLIENSNLTKEQVDGITYLYKLILSKGFYTDNYTSWVYLKAKYLEDKMGNSKNRTFCTQFLIENNIIERTEFYIELKQSFGYKLRNSTTEHSLTNNNKLTRESISKTLITKMELNKTWSHLNKATKTNLKHLHFSETYPDVANRLYGSTSFNSLACKNLVCDIICERYRSSLNSTNERLDSNITNLPSDMLECATLDNESIYSIDLSATGATLFLKNITSFSFVFYNDQVKREILDSIEFANEVKMWRERVVKGNFYINLAPHYGTYDIPSIKKDCQTFLYGESGKKHPIRKDFPLICKLIDWWKEKFGYEYFSVQLNKFESDIFIKGIFNELVYEGKICLTKHDCILCKESDKDFVLTVVKKYLDKIIGVGEYNLKIERISK